MTTETTARVFADNLFTYVEAGWPCVLPVPPARKYPPPGGFTGGEGRDTNLAQLIRWAGSHADHSVALRMPEGVIGIDVDHYPATSRTGEVVDKRGADTLAEHEQRWGPLPATWVSTARELPSGIRFYRAPAGRYRTSLGEAVEIIQRHHRYAVVAPSPHPSAGGAYRWITPEGAEAAPDVVPNPDDLPELPVAWVEGLREGASEAGRRQPMPLRGGHYSPNCSTTTTASPVRRSSTRTTADSPHSPQRARVAGTTPPPPAPTASSNSARPATPGQAPRWPSCARCGWR